MLKRANVYANKPADVYTKSSRNLSLWLLWHGLRVCVYTVCPAVIGAKSIFV